ncbi:MAG: hypothetical protein RLZZ436_2372 [Planctomycetota bacterium]
MDFFRILMGAPIFQSVLGPIFRPIIRPLSRVLIGIIAIPLFRLMLRKVFRIQEISEELEKDLREWFRASLLLLAATANMEHLLFSWLVDVDWLDRADWLTMGLRLLMVIGVIQTMPDQELFAVLHPGPPKLAKGIPILQQLSELRWQIVKGVLCRHINKSSPVLAMMCAIVGGELSPPPRTTELIETQRRLCVGCTMAAAGIQQQASAVHPTLYLAATTLYFSGLAESDPFHARLSNGAHPSPGFYALAEYNDDKREYDHSRTRFFVGWICYLAAISQYLIIGLVTSRDRAMKVLTLFDQAVAERRREIIETYNLQDQAEPPEPEMPATD